MQRRTTPEEEKRALELGAKKAAVIKWRSRGIPFKWRWTLHEADRQAEQSSRSAQETGARA